MKHVPVVPPIPDDLRPALRAASNTCSVVMASGLRTRTDADGVVKATLHTLPSCMPGDPVAALEADSPSELARSPNRDRIVDQAATGTECRARAHSYDTTLRKYNQTSKPSLRNDRKNSLPPETSLFDSRFHRQVHHTNDRARPAPSSWVAAGSSRPIGAAYEGRGRAKPRVNALCIENTRYVGRFRNSDLGEQTVVFEVKQTGTVQRPRLVCNRNMNRPAVPPCMQAPPRRHEMIEPRGFKLTTRLDPKTHAYSGRPRSVPLTAIGNVRARTGMVHGCQSVRQSATDSRRQHERSMGGFHRQEDQTASSPAVDAIGANVELDDVPQTRQYGHSHGVHPGYPDPDDPDPGLAVDHIWHCVGWQQVADVLGCTRPVEENNVAPALHQERKAHAVRRTCRHRFDASHDRRSG